MRGCANKVVVVVYAGEGTSAATIGEWSRTATESKRKYSTYNKLSAASSYDALVEREKGRRKNQWMNTER